MKNPVRFFSRVVKYVKFARFEKVGARKTKVPVYGYEHTQSGLATWPALQNGLMQLFDGVEYDVMDDCWGSMQ